MLDVVAHDLRYALRAYRRSAGFTATAVLSLAVGIGAATGLFSVVYAVLLNPYPYADADRIVSLGMNDRGTLRIASLDARQFVALDRSQIFDGLFALDIWTMTLTSSDLPEAVATQYFSANGMGVLGIVPLIGRVFTPADGPPGEEPARVRI
jgi:hypothetical protein